MAYLNEEHLKLLWDKVKEYVAEHGSSGYTLPIATTTKLGGVKANSSDVTVNETTGVMSVVAINDTVIEELPI